MYGAMIEPPKAAIKAGLNFVSCSNYRLLIGKLAATQVELKKIAL
jgi:hypothetical protein